MAVNKVIFGGTTLLDLTNDTVTAADILNGKTAHISDGRQVIGTYAPGFYVENDILYLTTLLDGKDEVHLCNTFKDSDDDPLLDHNGNEIDSDGIIIKGGQYA